MIEIMELLETEIAKVKATIEKLRMMREFERMFSRTRQANRLQVILDLLESEYYDLRA